MKNKKLAFRVRCTEKIFYLSPASAGSNDWHVRFSPPREVREKLGIAERVYRTTGTCEIGAAKEVARRIIESFWPDAKGVVTALGSIKARNGFATLGEIFERYEANSKQRRRTNLSNMNALRRIVRSVHGGDPDTRRCDVLTAGLIRRFEAESRMAAVSIASYVRQARSVFAPKVMKFYEDLELPDLSGFRTEPVESPEIRDLEPPDLNALRSMDLAAVELAKVDPAVYVAHLLFSRNGRRNIEILNARTSWIMDERIGIIKRPEEGFYPKGRSGWPKISGDVVAEIMRFQHLCTDGYLVPGKDKTERYDAIYRRHSQWVRKFIRGSKTSYELRRYYGSRLLDLGWNIYQVSNELLHRNVSTTERWYAYRLPKPDLPGIGMTNLIPLPRSA